MGSCKDGKLGQEAVGTKWAQEPPLNTRKHFSAVWVTEHWHSLPRGHGVASLKKSCLHVGLGTLLWVALLEHELDKMDPEVHLHFSHSVILWCWMGSETTIFSSLSYICDYFCVVKKPNLQNLWLQLSLLVKKYAKKFNETVCNPLKEKTSLKTISMLKKCERIIGKIKMFYCPIKSQMTGFCVHASNSHENCKPAKNIPEALCVIYCYRRVYSSLA